MPMFKVINLGCPEELKEGLNINGTPYKLLYDPLNLVIGGVEFPLYEGDPLLQTEAVVKHWFGDWSIEKPEEYDKEMDRVEALHGFVPNVKIERVITKSEKEARTEKERETKHPRPEIAEAVLGEGGTFGVPEEVAAEAETPMTGVEFSLDDIEKAEKTAKKGK